MNIEIDKTLEKFQKHLAGGLPELYKAYEDLIRLRSQLLGIIHDQEGFGQVNAAATNEKPLADSLVSGTVRDYAVTLTIQEPLPALREMTGAVQDHWLNLMQAAIGDAIKDGQCPYYGKAFVLVIVETPRGTNNAKLWDTSNRAVNLIINNLKGVFFEDYNHEHMAFGVIGRWGEKGVTIVRIMPFDKLGLIEPPSP